MGEEIFSTRHSNTPTRHHSPGGGIFDGPESLNSRMSVTIDFLTELSNLSLKLFTDCVVTKHQEPRSFI